MFSGHDKAQLADLCGKAQGEASYCRGLDVSWLRNQSTSVVVETSNPPMKSTVSSATPEASTASISPISCPVQASELLASNPTRVLGALETDKVSVSRSSSTVVALDSGKAVSSMCTVSNAEVTHGLRNRGSGFTGEMVVSSATATIEAPILNVVPSSLG